MQDTMTREHKDIAAPETKPDENQLHKVEALVNELKHLLECNDTVFDDEIIGRQMQILETWMECYHSGIIATATFHETSTALLTDLRGRLKLAAEELQRLEGEGGNPASKEQVEKNEGLNKAIRRSEKLISNIEELFVRKQ